MAAHTVEKIEIVEKYLEEEINNGIAEKSIKARRALLNGVNKFKPLDVAWNRDDINAYLTSVQTTYSESSIQAIKITLKKYFTWTGKPEIVEHLKIKVVNGSLKREDILTIEDINKLIDATPSTMYKALISFLFESGARINEALNIKVKDIQETDKGMIISVPATKTGIDYRRCLATFSSQYIRNHITYNALAKDDFLFDITPGASWEMLKKIGEKAGIDKPISAHKFRHSQACDMVKRGYNESIIRKKLGWTGDSKMIARYTHLNDDDVINATAEMTGSEIPKQPMANLKQAESLKIADASLQLSKLSAENEELKDKMASMESLIQNIASKLNLEMPDDISKVAGVRKVWQKA